MADPQPVLPRIWHRGRGPAAALLAVGGAALLLRQLGAVYPVGHWLFWPIALLWLYFVYVDDIVDALLAVPRRGMGQGVIQIGSERPTSVRELAQMIVRISGKSIEPQFDASKPSGDRGRIACCERARAILDWHPRVTLEEGLARSYAWTERAMMDAAREPG
jgi:nucleoside-diphosphate-sugar epimerase